MHGMSVCVFKIVEQKRGNFESINWLEKSCFFSCLIWNLIFGWSEQCFLVKRGQMCFHFINALIPAGAACPLQAMFSFLQLCDFTAGTLQAVCLPMLNPVCPSSFWVQFVHLGACTVQYLLSGEFNEAISKIVGAPSAQGWVMARK